MSWVSWPLLLLCVLSLAEANARNRRQAETSTFSCQGRVPGYYADPESGCQAYHMCEAGGRKFSYRCPEHTLFQQRMMVCDHWFMVDCRSSPQHYAANLLLGDQTKPFIAKGEHIVRELQPPSKSRGSTSGKRQQNDDVIGDDITTPLSTIVQQYTFPATILTSAVRANRRGDPVPTSNPDKNRTSGTSNFQQVKPTTVPIPRDRLSTTKTIPQSNRVNPQTTTPSFTTKSPIPRDRLSSSTTKTTQQTTKFNSPTFTTKTPFNTQTTKIPSQQNRNPSFNTPSNTQNFIPQTTMRPLNTPIQNRNPSVNTNIPSNNQNFVPQTTTIRPIIQLPLKTNKVNPTSKFPFNTQRYIPETTRRPLGLSATTLSLIKSSFNLTSDSIQTTTFRPTTQIDEVLYPATINSLIRDDPPLLRLILDPRRMFYIGDDEPSVFEQSLQFIDPNVVENRRSDFEQNLEYASPSLLRPMRFNDRGGRAINGECPSKCLPAFLRPGSCEPCVMLR